MFPTILKGIYDQNITRNIQAQCVVGYNNCRLLINSFWIGGVQK